MEFKDRHRGIVRPMPVPFAYLHSPDGRDLGVRLKNLAWAQSPVLNLVSAVYVSEVGQAHATLRSRIYVNQQRNEADRNTVKVCASKITFDPNLEPPPSIEWIDSWALYAQHRALEAAEVLGSFSNGHDHPARLMRELKAAAVVGQEPLARRDRAVVSALLAENGEVVLVARNTNGHDRCRHAEMNLLLMAERAGLLPLPGGAKIFSTLSPCRMCAAWCCRVVQEPTSVEVFCAQEDFGRYGQQTMLHALKRLRFLKETP